ncbi:MAG: hypothetical protein Q7T20_11010 [Saprospiraceae bacterium]|nr:hypothetical protein [Saprospiraceae bacterium]
MLGNFFRKPKPQPHSELDLPDVDKDERSEIANLRPKSEADAGIVIPPSKPPLLSAENIALIAILLLLVTGSLGVWSWIRFSNLDEIRQTEAKQHEVMLDSLLQVKTALESNLDQLQTDFADLSSENDTLAERLATTTNIVAEKEAAIQEIKSQNVREEKALREQVQRLQTIKDRYETIIAVLDQKNARLTIENERLRGVTDSLFTEISDLGIKLEAQIRKTLSAQYKATGFRIDLERRNDKPTIRAKRTRELKVYFELNQVPESYRGNQKLYLVITDDRGTPIPSENPIDAYIQTERSNIAITAQATQLQNVIENQRIEMAYKLEDRLKKGTYIVSVYSEKGPLGVASFRLT